VDHIEPLKPSRLDKGLNLSGTVIVEIRFEPNGSVACVRAKSGNPIAISAAIAAVPKWTFKPVVSNAVTKAGCGQITIKYRLRDKGSSTELQ
jgi:TonB family protein